MRVVLPPSWTVATFVVLYLATEVFRALLEPWVALTEQDRVWVVAAPRNGMVLMAIVLYAVFRTLGFHPLTRYEYGRWLYETPWRHPQPLPFGPVHLTPQDGLLLGLAVLLCHGSLQAQWAVPQAFLVVYLAALSFLSYVCGLRWRVYLLVFGLGLMVRLSPWSPISVVLVAAVLYPMGLWALSATLAGYPWPASVVQAVARQTAATPTRRRQAGYDKTELGWPFDLLQKPIEVPRQNWIQLAVETVLTGWVVYAAFSSIPELALAALRIMAAFAPLFGVVRLITYCWHCRPPISVWGRIFTGRWIIPGYDQVLVAPLCVLVVGGILPILMLWTALPGELSLAISVAALVLVYRGIGPSWPRWLLTGNHRLVPGITNRQEFQEI
jgi:hypothetical protein